MFYYASTLILATISFVRILLITLEDVNTPEMAQNFLKITSSTLQYFWYVLNMSLKFFTVNNE